MNAKDAPPPKPPASMQGAKEDWSMRHGPVAKFMHEHVAEAQRGAPESAMLKVQFAMGGGVLNGVVEHVGDLTHRMAELPTWDTGGHEYVKNKVEKSLYWLKKPYGFEREFNENIKNNAEFKGKTEEEYRQKVYDALDKYAEAHYALPAFNDAQYFAKRAAYNIGKRNFRTAIYNLERLEEMLSKGKDEWVAEAHKIDPKRVTESLEDNPRLELPPEIMAEVGPSE